jgi:hypothetical protein
MFFLTLVRDYTIWHYSTALVAFVRLYKNFWWFLVQFFSIPQLTSSLFAPYKRITERRGSLLDIEAWFSFIIINTISRLIGFCIRVCIIGFGLACLFILLVSSVLTYGFWLVAPGLLVYCFGYGLYLLF